MNTNTNTITTSSPGQKRRFLHGRGIELFFIVVLILIGGLSPLGLDVCSASKPIEDLRVLICSPTDTPVFSIWSVGVLLMILILVIAMFRDKPSARAILLMLQDADLYKAIFDHLKNSGIGIAVAAIVAHGLAEQAGTVPDTLTPALRTLAPIAWPTLMVAGLWTAYMTGALLVITASVQFHIALSVLAKKLEKAERDKLVALDEGAMRAQNVSDVVGMPKEIGDCAGSPASRGMDAAPPAQEVKRKACVEGMFPASGMRVLWLLLLFISGWLFIGTFAYQLATAH
ncbi:hypothetical protein PQR21_13910 [Paraburkholderia nemoris]|uniref:hypothetical protein n=1 Tax=Paraburkholderia nemoris TaxID=2793076 RepID=UPI0038BDC8DB